MSGSEEHPGPEAPSLGVLPVLADLLPRLGGEFGERGLLGLLLVEAPALAGVESSYGERAHDRALGALAGVVSEVCGGALARGGLLGRGEFGRKELVVALLREPSEGGRLLEELPELEHALRGRLERQGSRLFYPYLRTTAGITTGRAVALRNPKLAAHTQIRDALESARRDAELNSRIEHRDLVRRFTQLIYQQNISSVYEPIVEAKTFTVFGYEALARGPAGSEFASPAVLFDLAAREHLVYELDCLCRRKGLEGARDFPAGTKLFLNIRPTCFHDPSFQPDALRRTLDECRLTPADLVFEISEQESIENYRVFREARDFYGSLGFQFALDDTGAGYASLEAVMELTPEFVKVDRAFVTGIDEDPARQAMVQAFKSVAERLNARIIGEGLSTLEELQTLAELGIELGQGWLFGKPTPLSARS